MEFNAAVEKAMAKFPKAKKIAVENFSAGYDKMNYEAAMNLSMDARMYKWNAATVAAIKFVINNKGKG